MNDIIRFVKNTVTEAPAPTLGVEYMTKSIILKDGTVVKAQIWDTCFKSILAGSERYKSITTAHYRKSAGALLFYDITDKITFQNTVSWLKEIKNNTEENTLIMLIGNKYDAVAENPSLRNVTTEEAVKLSEQYNLMYTETSGKTGYNVKEAFATLIEAIHQEQLKVQAKFEQENNQNMKLKLAKKVSFVDPKSKGDGCCGLS